MQSREYIRFILILIFPSLCFGGRIIFVDCNLVADCAGNYSIANRDCSGSDGTAYRTPQGAANVAQAGDTVYFRAGTYGESVAPDGHDDTPTMTILVSGTLGNPITFTNYNGEEVIISGAREGENGRFYAVKLGVQPSGSLDHSGAGVEYVTIDGLIIEGASRGGLLICGEADRVGLVESPSRNVIVRNCISRNNIGTGGYGHGIRSIGTLIDCLIEDCEAYGNSGSGISYGRLGKDWHLTEADDDQSAARTSVIQNCISHDNNSVDSPGDVDGFGCTACYRCTLNDNISYGNTDDGMDVYMALEVNIVDNIVFDHHGLGNKCGIKCAAGGGGRHTLTGNVVFDNGNYSFEASKPSSTRRTYCPSRFIGNLSYNNGSGICLGYNYQDMNQPGFTLNYLRDNVLFGNESHDVYYALVGYADSDYNFIGNASDFSTMHARGFDGNSVSGDPGLVNKDVVIDVNFVEGWTHAQKLASIRNQVAAAFAPDDGSILIDAGVVISGYHDPSAGGGGGLKAWYGDAPDIGVYEYGGSPDPNNHAPVLAAIGSRSATVDSLLTFTISATDADGDTITYSATSLPTGATLTGQTFTWTPTSAQEGPHNITFIASDGAVQDSETVTITVTSGTNRPPVLAAIGSKSVSENSLLTFTISATDPDGDTVTYSATGLPTGATLTGQSFSWRPGYTQAGTHNITFIASDGASQDSEVVAVTVSNTNRPPVLAAIGSKSANEGSLLSFSVSATDPDIDDTITYSTGTIPSGAAFAGQTFTWTPAYDRAGSASVTFTVSDGHTQDSETVTITVNNSNRAPVLDDIADKSVNENTLLTFGVSATDPDGDPLSYSATGLPSGATFAGQTFSWTPSSSQADSSHQVTFIAGDGQLNDSQTVTIAVTDTLAPSVTNRSPAAGSIQAPLNSLIILHVTDAGKGVNAGTVTITLDGSTICSGDTSNYVSATGNCRRTGTKADYAYAYQSSQTFDFDQTKTVTVNATDLGGNVMSEQSYSFRTEMRSFGQNKLLGSDIEGLDKGAPATVRDSSGNIWAAWHAGPAGSRDIYLAKLTAGSASFGAGVQVTTDAADQCNPAVALGTDDKLYVVWQDNRRGDWDIYGSTSTNGTAWSDQQRITDSNDNQINPAIAVDRQSPNRAHVVWQDDRAGNQDIYIATSSNAFITNTITRITSNTSDQTTPAVAASSSNTVYVLWTDARNSSKDIYGAAGSSWTNVPVVTKAADQSSPAIAVESAGSILHILWVDQTSGNSDIYYASSNGLPSSPLTGTNLIDDTSGAEQTSPAIAVTGSTGSSLKVFACWNDARNISGGAGDTDIYLVQANAGSGTNVLISDAGANSNQTEPATGTDQYGYPYIVWSDDRGVNTEIYFAASTFMQSSALASQLITAASGGTVGTNPNAVTGVDDVSIVLPAGACPYDVTITIAKIENPRDGTLPLLNGYDFSPSGIVFNTPVTITMPYAVTGAAGVPTAYWYNSRTGDLSQQEITDVEVIVITPTLHALRFKTTHLTPFYALLGTAAGGGGGGGGGGGCSVSPTGQGSILEMLVPCLGLAVVMAILKLRDARNRNARNCDPPPETIPFASGAHLRQSRAIASKYVGL